MIRKSILLFILSITTLFSYKLASSFKLKQVNLSFKTFELPNANLNYSFHYKKKITYRKSAKKINISKKKIIIPPVERIQLSVKSVSNIIPQGDKGELEGRSHIETTGFVTKNVVTISWVKRLKSLKIPKTEKPKKKLIARNKIKKDEVKLALSGNKKIEAKKLEDKSKKLFIVPKITQAKIDNQISKNVQKVIQRELDKKALKQNQKEFKRAEKKPKKLASKIKVPLNVVKTGFVKNEYSNEMSTQKYASLINKIVNNEKKGKGPSSELSLTKIVGLGVSLYGQGNENVSFEIHSQTNEADIEYSDKSEVILKASLNSPEGTHQYIAFSNDSLKTRFDVTFSKGRELDLFLPLINLGEIERLLVEDNLTGEGGFLLVELDKNIESIDVDSSFEKKIFLNNHFKKVNSISDSTYILYIGILPGNRLVSAINSKRELLEKIVHVVSDEVLFINTSYDDSYRNEIELYERVLLTKKNIELDLDLSKIQYFNKNIKFTKTLPYKYKFINPPNFHEMRNYIELSHLNGNVYIGFQEHKKLVVPSQPFIDYILYDLGLKNLGKSCVVQINLKKEADRVHYIGQAINGYMQLSDRYLSNDGIFEDTLNDLTETIFIVGHDKGLINIEIDYIDNTKDIFQTFCSESSYIVEQL